MSGKVRVEYVVVDMTTGEIKDKVSVEREVGKKQRLTTLVLPDVVVADIVRMVVVENRALTRRLDEAEERADEVEEMYDEVVARLKRRVAKEQEQGIGGMDSTRRHEDTKREEGK